MTSNTPSILSFEYRLSRVVSQQPSPAAQLVLLAFYYGGSSALTSRLEGEIERVSVSSTSVPLVGRLRAANDDKG